MGALAHRARNYQTVFRSGCGIFLSPSAMSEEFGFSISSPILFNYGHSEGYEAVSRRGFNFYFPNYY